ncbi:MAG: FAD-dependent oxidoreductase [Firmicutes bacterium]|nr:FAD-dependent oxidoreductase [Bacillota bacterium]
MKILVIGAVAAGTKAAAKLKRNLGKDAQVTILTKSKDISYAGCGLPYYIGGIVESRAELLVNTPDSFSKLTGVEVLTGMEAVKLMAAEKKVAAKNVDTGEESVWEYDKLIIATGAAPVVPPIPGVDLEGVHVLRTPDDADGIIAAVEAGAKRAVVIGGGYIGLEVAENLTEKGLRVSVLEMLPHIMPGFDSDFAEFAENRLADERIMVFTNTAVTGIEGEDGHVAKVLTEKKGFKADLVVLSTGIRPATSWLQDSGIEMFKGTVVVDDRMHTSLDDVYAVGDCATARNFVTQTGGWSPMGSTANIVGRICANEVSGKAGHGYRGALGTAIVKLPGLNCAKTGLSQEAAVKAGFDAVSATLSLDSKAHFMPDSTVSIVRLTADKNTHKLLGAQIMGGYGVDKFIDIAVTAITLGACIEDLEDMDLAYAPPFATAMDSFTVAVNVMMNKLCGNLVGGTLEEAGDLANWKLLDVAKEPMKDDLPYYPVQKLTQMEALEGIPADTPLLLLCAKGRNSYMAQVRLRDMGYQNTFVLEGGVTLYPEILED